MTTTLRLHRPEHTIRVFALGGALLGMLLLASAVEAQRGRGGGRGGAGPGRGGFVGRGMHNPERMIEHRVARMSGLLTLTDEQGAKVKDIFTAEHAQLEKLRPATRPTTRPDSATLAERRAEVKAIHDATLEQIDAVLTAEQRAQFDKVQEARKLLGIGRGGRGRGGFRRPPPFSPR